MRRDNEYTRQLREAIKQVFPEHVFHEIDSNDSKEFITQVTKPVSTSEVTQELRPKLIRRIRVKHEG